MIKLVLSSYERVSGQKVSLEKYAIYFSKHVRWGDSDELARILGVFLSDGKGKYLGLPYLEGRSKK